MDLKSILEKNKSKVEKHHFKQPAPSIATHDRPYIIDFNELDKKESEKPPIRKRVTNGYQTGNKQVSNGYQTGNKQVSNKSFPNVRKEKTGNKQVSEQVTAKVSNGYQTGNKQVSEQVTNIAQEQIHKTPLTTLVGIQRSIIVFFYFLTKKYASQSTPPLTLDYISNSLNIAKNVIKMTIIRLQKKGLLVRNSGKTGRGGWTSYEISNVLYKELMQQDNFGFLEDQTGNKQVTNGYQTGNKQVSEQVSEQVTTALSSSGINIINNKNTTTTNNTLARELPDVWQLECSLLDNVGFTQAHLLQLSQLGTLEPSIVQDSIYHFAFDLKHNNKASSIKGDPLSYFMGIVSRRGAYTAPSNYIDPALEAMNAYHKTKEQSEKQKAEIEQKVQEIEFRMWHDSLTDDEILGLLPQEILNAIGPASLKQRLKVQHLKKHYVETLWLERRRELCKSTPNWMTTEPVKP